MIPKKNILIIENSTGITGAYTSIYTVSQLLKEEYKFVWVFPSSIQIDSLPQNKYQLPFIEISKKLANLLLYFPVLIYNSIRIIQIVKNNKIDIIHVNDFYNLSAYLSRLLVPNLFLVIHIRFLPNKFPPVLYKFWLFFAQQFADRIICPSETVSSFMKRSAKFNVIYDPLTVAEKELPYQAYSRSKTSIQLLYLSNFTNGKGHDFALEAFAIALRENSNLNLIMAGGDFGKEKNRQYKASLIEKAKLLKIDDKVVFKGFVDDVEPMYKSCHIFLNFSESESLSITSINSLYFGTPCIASKCGGPEEYIVHKKNGWLVENGNVEEMASAIVALSNDETLRHTLSANGKQTANELFLADKIKKQFKLLYESLLIPIQ